MVRNLSAALVAVLLLASTGIASAQSAWTLQRASQILTGSATLTATSGTAICPARPATTITA